MSSGQIYTTGTVLMQSPHFRTELLPLMTLSCRVLIKDSCLSISREQSWGADLTKCCGVVSAYWLLSKHFHKYFDPKELTAASGTFKDTVKEQKRCRARSKPKGLRLYSISAKWPSTKCRCLALQLCRYRLKDLRKVLCSAKVRKAL